MPHEDSIIPPVRAGEINSSLEINYDHEQCGEGGFEATSVHRWQFDSRQYFNLTGLDLGQNYPYVHQENGHALRIVTDYRWSHSTYNGEDKYTLSFEQRAVRGSTNIHTTYWTRCGYYRFDEDLNHTRMGAEKQPYRIRESDVDVDHHLPYDIGDHIAYSGEQLVRKLHSGILGPTLAAQFNLLLEMDSPDDALTVDEYRAPNTHTTPVPAND